MFRKVYYAVKENFCNVSWEPFPLTPTVPSSSLSPLAEVAFLSCGTNPLVDARHLPCHTCFKTTRTVVAKFTTGFRWDHAKQKKSSHTAFFASVDIALQKSPPLLCVREKEREKREHHNWFFFLLFVNLRKVEPLLPIAEHELSVGHVSGYQEFKPFSILLYRHHSWISWTQKVLEIHERTMLEICRPELYTEVHSIVDDCLFIARVDLVEKLYMHQQPTSNRKWSTIGLGWWSHAFIILQSCSYRPQAADEKHTCLLFNTILLTIYSQWK